MLNKIKTLFKQTKESGRKPAILSEELDGIEAWDAHSFQWLGNFPTIDAATRMLRQEGYDIVRDS